MSPTPDFIGRYQIVTCDSLGELERQVNTWLDVGWRCRGDLHVIQITERLYYVQVMVK